MAVSEALAMLRVARRDLKAARLLVVDEADEANWGFQMQQAIEKAFKACVLISLPTCSFPNSPSLLFNSVTTMIQTRRDSIAWNG